MNKKIGICYICKRELTESQAVSLGEEVYRCKIKECEKKIMEAHLKQIKFERKTWEINPVTEILPNKKKKTRAQNKETFKQELKEE